MENDRIIAILESLLETVSRVQDNLEKMKTHGNQIQSILSSPSSIVLEPVSVPDLGEHMCLENHHSDEMKFSNYMTPKSAEIDETLEEVTGIHVSIVLPSPADNRNNLLKAEWKSSELKEMGSQWTDSYCFTSFKSDYKGTVHPHIVFVKMPKRKLRIGYGYNSWDEKRRHGSVLFANVVNLHGWPPPPHLFYSKFDFSFQLMFSVVSHCRRIIVVMKLGRRIVLGKHDKSGFLSVDSGGDYVKNHFPWSGNVSVTALVRPGEFIRECMVPSNIVKSDFSVSIEDFTDNANQGFNIHYSLIWFGCYISKGLQKGYHRLFSFVLPNAGQSIDEADNGLVVVDLNNAWVTNLLSVDPYTYTSGQTQLIGGSKKTPSFNRIVGDHKRLVSTLLVKWVAQSSGHGYGSNVKHQLWKGLISGHFSMVAVHSVISMQVLCIPVEQSAQFWEFSVLLAGEVYYMELSRIGHYHCTYLQQFYALQRRDSIRCHLQIQFYTEVFLPMDIVQTRHFPDGWESLVCPDILLKNVIYEVILKNEWFTESSARHKPLSSERPSSTPSSMGLAAVTENYGLLPLQFSITSVTAIAKHQIFAWSIIGIILTDQRTCPMVHANISFRPLDATPVITTRFFHKELVIEYWRSNNVSSYQDMTQTLCAMAGLTISRRMRLLQATNAISSVKMKIYQLDFVPMNNYALYDTTLAVRNRIAVVVASSFCKAPPSPQRHVFKALSVIRVVTTTISSRNIAVQVLLWFRLVNSSARIISSADSTSQQSILKTVSAFILYYLLITIVEMGSSLVEFLAILTCHGKSMGLWKCTSLHQVEGWGLLVVDYLEDIHHKETYILCQITQHLASVTMHGACVDTHSGMENSHVLHILLGVAN